MDKTLKLYSTPRLAEAIGVSLVTIYRWVAAGKIKAQGPSYPHGDGVVMFWTEGDVANARKVKAEQRPGPTVKKPSKDRLARQRECE